MHFDPSASHLGCTVDFAIIFVPDLLRHCLISEGRFHMAQPAIRFSETTDEAIQEGSIALFMGRIGGSSRIRW
jgi:hypothetical protein